MSDHFMIEPAQIAQLTYVDAGHGLAVYCDANAASKRLNEQGGPPAGINPEFIYSSASQRLAPGGRILIVSDGLVEQRSGDSQAHEFGFESVIRLAADTDRSADLVVALFEALAAHAASTHLADDATAICVQW